MGRGEKAGAISGVLLAGVTLAACSSGPRVEASGSASPSRTVATAPVSVRSGESTPPPSASAGTPRPTGETTPGVSASTSTASPGVDRPPFRLPIVAGAKINVANCPALGSVEGSPDPAPPAQEVTLTATPQHPGETFLNANADAEFVSADGSKRVTISNSSLEWNVRGREHTQALDEPAIVQQTENANNLLYNGRSDVPDTACGVGDNALADFEDTIASKGIHHGQVTIVTMNAKGVQVTQGRI